MDTRLDTFPRLLLHHVQVRADHPAVREKEFGIWQTWTWARSPTRCARSPAAWPRWASARRAPRDHRRQPPAPLLVDGGGAGARRRCRCRSTRTRWRPSSRSWSNDAGVPLRHRRGPGAGRQAARGRGRGARARRMIYYDDPRGLRHYDGPVMSFERLQELGRRSIARTPTSSRPRSPRAARRRLGDALHLRHHRQPQGRRARPTTTFIERRGRRRASTSLDRERRACLPTCRWRGSGDTSSPTRSATSPASRVNCPESAEHGDDRPARDRPDLLLRAAARVREPAHPGDDPHGGRGRAQAPAVPRFMALARRVGPAILDGQPVGLRRPRCCTRLGNVLVYGPLRNTLGMSRVRVAYTAGEAIGPDLFSFYRSIGINLKQLYGSTETCVFVCLQPDGEVLADTVGMPATGVELKLADSGEVLFRSAGLLKEYYKNPEATAESIDRRRLVPHRRRRLPRRPRAPARSSTAPRTSASSPDGSDVRAQVRREQAQVLPATSRRRWRSATAATRSAPSSTSTWRRSATGPSGATCPTPATPISRQARGLRPGARVHREGQRATSPPIRAGRRPDPPLPHPAQGARRRRRRARRAPARCAAASSASKYAVWSTRSTTAGASSTSRPQVTLRGRPHRHARGATSHIRGRRRRISGRRPRAGRCADDCHGCR